jgi:hypothetical protein
VAGAPDDPWSRVERRLTYVEREIERRREHAHDLDLVVRELVVKTQAMDGHIGSVLSSIADLSLKLETHQMQETERRVTEIELREKESRANGRFRITTIVSVIGVLVVLGEIYLKMTP